MHSRTRPLPDQHVTTTQLGQQQKIDSISNYLTNIWLSKIYNENKLKNRYFLEVTWYLYSCGSTFLCRKKKFFFALLRWFWSLGFADSVGLACDWFITIHLLWSTNLPPICRAWLGMQWWRRWSIRGLLRLETGLPAICLRLCKRNQVQVQPLDSYYLNCVQKRNLKVSLFSGLSCFYS